MKTARFDPNCRACSRLDQYLAQIRLEYPEYHARPVPPFGADRPRLLIVGLAPGLHGANATGRPFTGDHAGILLYETLYRFGYTDRPVSQAANDGLQLKNCRITNAVKCVPPANKPTGSEITTCNRYLADELSCLEQGTVILALGHIAHRAIIKGYGLKQSDYPFVHGQDRQVPAGQHLLDSYHCSRYNTLTGRLTPEMFRDIFYKIDQLLSISN